MNLYARLTTDGRFLLATALVFLVSAVATIAWCASMSGMGGMTMPGGWTMSMAWMRMPGQTWPAAAASFLGMWTVMMVAMMLPAVTPLLLRHRHVRARMKLAGGYFLVWLLAGALLFPAGVALAGLAMRSTDLARAVPGIGALALLLAGALQLSSWKARWLACCRDDGCCEPRPGSGAAWRQGLRAGIDCCRCCLPLTIVLLALGVMDLAVMGAVTLAISAERLASRGEHVARITGAVLVAGGMLVLLRTWPFQA